MSNVGGPMGPTGPHNDGVIHGTQPQQPGFLGRMWNAVVGNTPKAKATKIARYGLKQQLMSAARSLLGREVEAVNLPTSDADTSGLQSFEDAVLKKPYMQQLTDALDDILLDDEYMDVGAQFNWSQIKGDPAQVLVAMHRDLGDGVTDLKWILENRFPEGSPEAQALSDLREDLRQYANSAQQAVLFEDAEFARRATQYDAIENEFQDINGVLDGIRDVEGYMSLEALNELRSEYGLGPVSEEAPHAHESEQALLVQQDSIDQGLEQLKAQLKERRRELKADQNALLEDGFMAKLEAEAIQGMVGELLINDSEFNDARALINQKVQSAGEGFDFEEAYLEDADFRNAYNIVNNRIAGFAGAIGMKLPTPELEITFGDAAAGALNIAKELPGFFAQQMVAGAGEAREHLGALPGNMICTPALVLGMSAAGVGLAAAVPTAMAAVYVHQKLPTELTRQGVFYDIHRARRDAELRRPLLAKVYTRALSEQERIVELKKLIENGALFKEDLKHLDRNLLKKAYKELHPEKPFKMFTAGLPKRSTLVKRRAESRGLLVEMLQRDETDDAAIALLKEMHGKGLLYKEDLQEAGVVRGSVRQAFLKDIPEDQLPSMTDLSKMRNDAIFVARSGDTPVTEKVAALVQLHKDGLLMKEDIEALRKFDKDLLGALVGELGESTIIALKSEREIYTSKESLVDRYTQDREIVLGAKGMTDSSGRPKLEGLKALWQAGCLFQSDFEGLDRELIAEFDAVLAAHEGALPKNRKDLLKSMDEIDSYSIVNQARNVAVAMANIVRAGGAAAWQKPSAIISGPAGAVISVIETDAESMDGFLGAATGGQVNFFQNAVARVRPSDQTVDDASRFVFNKGVAAAKGAIVGGAVGMWLANTFGAKVGGAIGAVYGLAKSNGKVNQLPKGGLFRALKFSAAGGVIAAVAVGLAVGVATLLAVGGVIALSTAMVVSTGGLALIIPLILLGIYAGYKIAGYTGKDNFKVRDDPIDEALQYQESYEYEGGFMAMAEDLIPA